MKQAVDRIQQAVRTEAEAEAARLLRETRAVLEHQIAAFQQEEEEKSLAAVDTERAMAEQGKFREVSRAQRSSRLAELAARNAGIDKIFLMIKEEVLKLPPATYRELLSKWLRELDASTGGDVLPARRDEKVIAEILKEINKIRAGDARLTLSKEHAQIEGGFVLKTARYEITRSLDDWLEGWKRELAPRLEAELFGE